MFLHEDDWSIWQACIDSDQGGQAQGADALPGPNQSGHANAVRRRKRRQKTAFKIVYKHIDNERIKEMLDALPDDDRRGAEAWKLVLNQCDLGASDLQMEEIRREFESARTASSYSAMRHSAVTFIRSLADSCSGATVPSAGSRARPSSCLNHHARSKSLPL